jgi:hypothetical protein
MDRRDFSFLSKGSKVGLRRLAVIHFDKPSTGEVK